MIAQFIGFDEVVEKAPICCFVAFHHAPGEEELSGSPLPDDAGQNGTRAHIAPGQTDSREKEGHLAVRRTDAKVRGHRHDGAGPHADALDRCNYHLRACANRLHQVARHPCETEEFGHIHLRQRPYDLMHVAAGAEIATRPAQDHHLDFVHVHEVAEGVAQLGIRLERERILLLRPVQGDGTDFIGELPLEVLGGEGVGGHLCERMRR